MSPKLRVREQNSSPLEADLETLRTSSLNRQSEDNTTTLLSPPCRARCAVAGVLPWLFWTPAILMPSNETVVFPAGLTVHVRGTCHRHPSDLTHARVTGFRADSRLSPTRPSTERENVRRTRVQSFIVQRCDRRHNIEGSSHVSVAKLIRGYPQRGSRFVRTQPTRASPGEASVSRPGPKAATAPHPPPRVASQKHPTVLAHTVSRKRSTPNSRVRADP